jgi:hypothetical protein
MAGQARIVANGSDDIFDWVHNFYGSPLEDRATPLFTQAGYQVLDFQVKTSVDLAQLFGSATYPYQASITLETGANPNTLDTIKQATIDALTQATGYAPNAIAITSAGQTAPGAKTSWIDDVLNKIKNLLGITLTAAQLLIIVLALGLGILIYWIAKHPAQARRLA